MFMTIYTGSRPPWHSGYNVTGVFPPVLPMLSNHSYNAVARTGTQQESETTQRFGRGSRNLPKTKTGESKVDPSPPLSV